MNDFQVKHAIERYGKEFSNSIPWTTIFLRLANFDENRQQILQTQLEDWQSFLYYLKYIESTIPTYDIYKGQEDLHDNWAKRTFTLFGRAELEEGAVIKSNLGTSLGLIRNPNLQKAGFFHSGKGQAIPDLLDKNGKTYDVKHESVDFTKAHKADYVIKYSSTGSIELYSYQAFKENKPSFVTADIYKSLKDICRSLNINEMLFNSKSTEEQIESYLGIRF